MATTKYATPQYQDTFRYNWEFEQYDNNRTEFWLEVDYFINRDAFETRIVNNTSPSLDWDVRAENKKKIFRDFNVSKYSSRGYKLLKELPDIANADEDILKVTELYGYAPSQTFVQYGSGTVQIPGLNDEAGYKKFFFPMASGTCTYDYMAKEFTIKIGKTGTSIFGQGDMVTLFGEKIISSEYNIITPFVEILQAYPSRGEIVVPSFSITWDGSLAEWDEYRTMWWLNDTLYSGGSKVNRNPYLIRRSKVRSPRAMQCSVKNTITYHNAFPTIQERMSILNGIDAELDTIDSQTRPNMSQWRNWVNNGSYFNIADSDIDTTYAPIIYKRTTKSTKCR